MQSMPLQTQQHVNNFWRVLVQPIPKSLFKGRFFSHQFSPSAMLPSPVTTNSCQPPKAGMENRSRAPLHTGIGQAGDWSIPKREKIQNRAKTTLHTFFTVLHIKLPFHSPPPGLASYSHGSVRGALSPGPWDFCLNPVVSEGCTKCSLSTGSLNTSTWTMFSRFQTMLSHFGLPPLQLFPLEKLSSPKSMDLPAPTDS